MSKEVEQITKADRLRMSRPLQKGKARATLRRLSSIVMLFIIIVSEQK